MPSRNNCHTAARNGHDHFVVAAVIPSTCSTCLLHISTSRNIEWLRLPSSSAGTYGVWCMAWAGPLSEARVPLHNQPDSLVGGLPPLLLRGGSATMRAATSSASGTRSSL